MLGIPKSRIVCRIVFGVTIRRARSRPSAHCRLRTWPCYLRLSQQLLQNQRRGLAALGTGAPGHARLTAARMLAHEGSHRQQTRDLLAGEGIVPERVQFHVPRPRPEYLALYHQIDIGLDTLPYNGHSTSLDQLLDGRAGRYSRRPDGRRPRRPQSIDQLGPVGVGREYSR